jgi:EAL domain-containing protein (putative c-di-GMP-specific phosphodiesterase class I)
VIDDDPRICAWISRVLQKFGATSLALSNAGSLAGALAATHPAIVFLDVGLERSDAIDGIRVLGERGFQGRVQLISGKDPALLNDIRTIGEQHGLKMQAPLSKPIRSEQLRLAYRGERTGGGASPTVVDGAVATAQPESAQLPRVDLGEAIDAHWLDVVYQPKLNLARRSLVGAEALARVNHPLHGQLAPAAFLPQASEEAMTRLTRFVIRKALLDWSVLDKAGCNLRLAINVPIGALTEGDLIEPVREFRPANEDWPGLIMEITEDEAIQRLDLVFEAAVQFRIYGVQLAIDDFGSGYSSFARLKQLPFSELKLDRSYVQNCATDRFNAGICRSIIGLAHASGAVCVAEGIEEEADCAALKRMGCDLGQGFLFARPMSIGSLIALSAPGRKSGA